MRIIIDFGKVFPKDSFLCRNTRPSDSLVTIATTTLVFTLLFAGQMLWCPVAFKPVAFPLCAILWSLLLIYPPHPLRRMLSFNLRANMINVVGCFSLGAECSAIVGEKMFSPPGLLVFLAMLLIWMLVLEPMIYCFMKRRNDAFSGDSNPPGATPDHSAGG